MFLEWEEGSEFVNSNLWIPPTGNIMSFCVLCYFAKRAKSLYEILDAVYVN